MNQEVLVKDMIRTMRIPQTHSEKPVVIIFVGAPATGKTTFAQKLLPQISFAYFTNEQIDSYLSPHQNFFDSNQKTLDFSFEVIKELVRQKVSVIYDFSVDRVGDREKIKKEVETLGGQLIVVYMQCDDQEVFKRIQNTNINVMSGSKKGFILDQDYYLFKKSQIQSPLSENAFVVDCNDEFASDRLVSLIQYKLTNPEKNK